MVQEAADIIQLMVWTLTDELRESWGKRLMKGQVTSPDPHK